MRMRREFARAPATAALGGLQPSQTSIFWRGPAIGGSITPAHILDFLDGPRPSYGRWCVKFSLLKFFFEYWLARGLVDPSPMPPLIRLLLALRQAFVPYLYTRNELRLLFQATSTFPA
jgi:hypothetical protein